jgi:hypothetical protein
LDAIPTCKEFPREKLFLSLGGSGLHVRDLELRSFDSGGREKIFILCRIEFADFAFRYDAVEELLRPMTDLRLADVVLTAKGFPAVSERVYIGGDSYSFDGAFPISECTGGPVLIRAALEIEGVPFTAVSGKSIPLELKLTPKSRDVVAALNGGDDFRGAIEIELQSGSSPLRSDHFLFRSVRASQPKQFIAIATPTHTFTNPLKGRTSGRSGNGRWKSDFRDDEKLSVAKRKNEAAWSTPEDSVEAEFDRHELADTFAGLRGEVTLFFLDLQFEFEFPDGHSEKRRLNQDSRFAQLSTKFPDQKFEYFDRTIA